MTVITKLIFIAGFAVSMFGQFPAPPKGDDIVIVQIVCDETCIPAHLVD